MEYGEGGVGLKVPAEDFSQVCMVCMYVIGGGQE
jgi:hypothetical protein